MKLTATNVAYHRNGISGKGFYVVTFDCEDGTISNKNMVAIRPAESDKSECYVLNIPMLAQGNVEFANGNSWRGDVFVDAVDVAIKEYEELTTAQIRARVEAARKKQG